MVRAAGAASGVGDQAPLFTLFGLLTAYGLLTGNSRAATAGARAVASVLVATAAKSAIKRTISRTRPNVVMDEGRYAMVPLGPDEGPWHSFPSGHTAGSVAAARALARVYPEASGPAYLAAAAIALVQVPRGAHYPTDVVAGAALGWGAEAIADGVWRRFAGSPQPHTGERGPEAVIFDVDGTLIDTVELHARAWVDALAHFGIPAVVEDMRLQIGKGGDQLLEGLLPPDLLARRGDEIKAFRSDLFKREYLPLARPFPEVRALFERIRSAGQRIVLASSGTAEEVERYTKLADVGDLIEGATSADDADRSKPFPDIFEAALRRLAPVPAAAAIVIGDTPYDAEAARGAHIRCVGVLSGGFGERALRDAGCVAVYRDAADLVARYESSPLARD